MSRALLAKFTREQVPEGPRRALVLLLLEDVDARLSLNHACELLTSRGVAFGEPDGLASKAALLRLLDGSGLDGGSSHQGLHPACLRLDRPPSSDASIAVVRLDIASLVQHLRSQLSDPESLELLGAAWAAEHSRLTAGAVDNAFNHHMAVPTTMLTAPVMPIIHTLATTSPPLSAAGGVPPAQSGSLHQYMSMAVSTSSVHTSAEHPAVKWQEGSSLAPTSGSVPNTDHHMPDGVPTATIAAVAAITTGSRAGAPTLAGEAVALAAPPPAAGAVMPSEKDMRDLLFDSGPSCSGPTSTDSAPWSYPVHNSSGRRNDTGSNAAAATAVALPAPTAAAAADDSPPPSNPGPTTASGALAAHLSNWQGHLLFEPGQQPSSAAAGAWGYAQSCDEPVTTSTELPVAQSGTLISKSKSSPVSHDDEHMHPDISATAAHNSAPAAIHSPLAKNGVSSDAPATATAAQGSCGQVKPRTSEAGGLSKSLITASLQQQQALAGTQGISQATPPPAIGSPTGVSSGAVPAVAAAMPTSPSSCDEVLPGFGTSRSGRAPGALWSAAAAVGRSAHTAAGAPHATSLGPNNDGAPASPQALQPAGSIGSGNTSQGHSLLSGSGGNQAAAPGMLAASTTDSSGAIGSIPTGVWDALSSAHQLLPPYQQQQIEQSQLPKAHMGQYGQLAGQQVHASLTQPHAQLQGNLFQRTSLDSHSATRGQSHLPPAHQTPGMQGVGSFHEDEHTGLTQQSFQHPMVRSYDEVPGGTGAMDLDSALEALLSYESAAKHLLQQQHQQHQAGASTHGGNHFAAGPGNSNGGGVSPATAVAAQHTLQRHVAAAVRAAAAVHDRNNLTATLAGMNVGHSQPPAPPFYSQPASQDMPNHMQGLVQQPVPDMHAGGWGHPLQQQRGTVTQQLHNNQHAAVPPAAAVAHSASTTSLPTVGGNGGMLVGSGSLDSIGTGPSQAMWGVLGGAANAPNAAGNLQWISGSVLHPSYANGLLGNNMLHAGGRGSDARTLLSRLNPRIRTEVLHLLLAVPTLKIEDFDEGVLLQLVSKRSEDEAVGALRTLAASGDTLAAMHNPSAYLAHVIQSYQLPGGTGGFAAPPSLGILTGSLDSIGSGGPDLTAMLGPQMGPGSATGGKTMVGSLPGNLAMTLLARQQQQQQQQLSSMGVSSFGSAGLTGILAPGLGGAGTGATLTAAGQSSLANLAPAPAAGTFSLLPSAVKVALQRLPPRVLRRLEEVVAKCSYMDWKHFDAGVVKVMHQLSELCESDVIEELQLLEATDLSNVEYMPAYLNKRLNNRLWSRRKTQQQQQQQQQAVSLVTAQHLVGL